jgi:hypothetical protein
LVVKFVAEGGHHIASVQDGGGDAIVVGGCSAGEIGLFVEALEAGAVKAFFGVGVVATGAVVLEDVVAGGFLGGELSEGFGWG